MSMIPFMAEIRSQLEDGAMFEDGFLGGRNAEVAFNQRMDESRGFSEGEDSLNEICDEQEEALGEETPDEVEALASLAGEAARRAMGRFSTESWEETICGIVEVDFDLIGRCLWLGIESPFLNGIWISYRAGRFPTLAIEVPGPFSEALEMSREKALEIVVQAEGDREAA
jgi:hypothetical protein